MGLLKVEEGRSPLPLSPASHLGKHSICCLLFCETRQGMSTSQTQGQLRVNPEALAWSWHVELHSEKTRLPDAAARSCQPGVCRGSYRNLVLAQALPPLHRASPAYKGTGDEPSPKLCRWLLGYLVVWSMMPFSCNDMCMCVCACRDQRTILNIGPYFCLV